MAGIRGLQALGVELARREEHEFFIEKEKIALAKQQLALEEQKVQLEEEKYRQQSQSLNITKEPALIKKPLTQCFILPRVIAIICALLSDYSSTVMSSVHGFHSHKIRSVLTN